MKVERTIEIDAPARDVYDVVMDPSRLRDWVTIHDHLEDAPEGRLKHGSKLTQRLKLAGRSFTVRWTVVENDPCRRVVWEGRGPVGSARPGGLHLRRERAGHALLLYEQVRPSGRGGRARCRPRGVTGYGKGAGRLLAATEVTRRITVTVRPMADFLDEKRKEIDARLKELRPLVDEYNRLEKAAAALAGVGNNRARPATRRQSRGARQRPPRPAAWKRHAREAGARARPDPPRDHDRGARRRDEHQGELPVPRDAHPRVGGTGGEAQRGLAPGLGLARRFASANDGWVGGRVERDFAPAVPTCCRLTTLSRVGSSR